MINSFFLNIHQSNADLFLQIEDRGVPIDACDGDHATPLHFAASKGHIDIVRWLVDRGAAILPDKFGKTPVDDAVENKQDEVLGLD